MNNKPLIIIFVILGGLLLLTGGFYGGVLVQTEKTAPQLKTLSNLQNLLKSKVIVQETTLFAYGTVKEIKDRKLVLESFAQEKETLEIPISNDAKIITFAFAEILEPGETLETGEVPPPQRKEVKFEDIKIGERVSVDVKVKPDGSFEGQNVGILPY